MTKVRTPNLNFPRYSVLIAFLALMVGIGILAAPSKGHAQNRTAANFNGAISVRPPVHGMSAFPARALYAAANQDSSQGAAPPAASSQPNLVEMPDGDGKAIAIASCQTCHKLTNLTRAHKSPDEWRETVQTMMDRGAQVPEDKVEMLLQYLAKNFGPKANTPDSGAPAAGGPSTSSPQP